MGVGDSVWARRLDVRTNTLERPHESHLETLEGIIDDEANVVTPLTGFGFDDAQSTKMLDEFSEGDPLGSVHVDMEFVGDVLLVDIVGKDALVGVGATQEGQELLLELIRLFLDEGMRRASEHQHLATMRLTRDVALEAVVIAALLLAQLAPGLAVGGEKGREMAGVKASRMS